MNTIEKLKNYAGWDFESECIRETDAHYNRVFGNQGRQPKDWRPYLPTFEDQKSTAFCLTFSILNCFETLIKYKNEGKEINFSDRWTGVKAKTSHRGNTFSKVADAIREHGLTLERYCSWKSEWLESPSRYWKEINDLPKDVKIVSGKTFNHSWVPTNLASLKNALADTPLWIGVGVGSNWENSVVSRPASYMAYHGVSLVYIDNKYKYIFDSLGNQVKRLSLSYPVLYAKSSIKLPDDWRLRSMAKLFRKKGKNEVVATIGKDHYWFNSSDDFNNFATEIPWLNWDNVEEVNEFPFEYDGRTIGKSNYSELVKQLLGKAPEMKGL